MESLSERDRYISNPLRLLRSLADLALRPVNTVGEAQDCWSDDAYPPLTKPETPAKTEDELGQGYLF